jgi:hypothetical protein
MAIGGERSPLLIGDEPEEGWTRTSMRRALRFAGASPRFQIHTRFSRSPGHRDNADARSPTTSMGDLELVGFGVASETTRMSFERNLERGVVNP